MQTRAWLVVLTTGGRHAVRACLIGPSLMPHLLRLLPEYNLTFPNITCGAGERNEEVLPTRGALSCSEPTMLAGRVWSGRASHGIDGGDCFCDALLGLSEVVEALADCALHVFVDGDPGSE